MRPRTIQPKVDISYTTGKHQFKFGFSYNRYTKNQMLYGDAQGNYSWGQLSGDTLMDVLLGLPSNYSQNQLAPIRHYVNQTPSVYAQDNWHVTPRLSLQLGLRYDALPHAWERSNSLATSIRHLPDIRELLRSGTQTAPSARPARSLYTYDGYHPPTSTAPTLRA